MPRPTRVLVITPQYAPDFGPSAPIYTALCEDLLRMGDEVTVVTGFPNYAGKTKRPAGKLIEKGEWNGVPLMRVYVASAPKNSLARRLVYHASYNLFAALAALRVKKPDVILADAPTLWSGLPLLLKAVLPGVPFIYIVHDIYPDVLVKLGMLRSPRLIDIVARVEKFFYDRAARISVLSDDFKRNLMDKKVPAGKLTVIPACVDTEFFRPQPRENDLRERWGLSGKFVVLYAGNIGFSQGLEIVLEAARQLLEREDIQFVIVGEGATQADLQARAALMGLTNVQFRPFQPREDVPQVYGLADVCLVSLKKDVVAESVPSKTYTIMACGRPIIAVVNRTSEAATLITDAECGLCIEPGDASGLAEAVLELNRNMGLRVHMEAHGRFTAINRYGRQVAADLYQQMILNVAAQTRGGVVDAPQNIGAAGGGA